MPLTRILPLTVLLALSGCVYHTHEHVDEVVCNMALHPFDPAPPGQAESPKSTSRDETHTAPVGPTDVMTAAYLQADKPDKPNAILERLKLERTIPGTWRDLPNLEGKSPEERRQILNELFPKFEPLPTEPIVQPGPGGKPYSLTELQQLATQYSPALKIAAAAVDAARGNMLQARAYPNPTFSYSQQPGSNGLSPTNQSFILEQTIKTGGKLKLQEAAARMELLNAELALRRARSDLATQVRNAYFGLLVAKETMRVNRAIARLTEEVYRFHVDKATSNLVAVSEPAAVQAQAEQARLAFIQSIKTYEYAWKQLVAAVGLRERDMPLSEVSGRIDAFVPRYTYDQVLAQVLTRHTDILSAQNTVEKAKYNLQLARITPWMQDFDVSVSVTKDYSVPPNNVVPGITIGVPLSVWDQNKGNVIAAEAGLTQSLEQQHSSEQTWTTTLSTNFISYENNLKGLETYRRILPQLVLYYRGVLYRYAELGGQAFKTPFAFADLVTAQQALTTGVSAYLTLLGQMWTSAVSVADPLQTDDLFQIGQPESLLPIPDLEHLPSLPCEHDCPAHDGAPAAGCLPTVTPSATPSVPMTAPTTLPLLPIRRDEPSPSVLTPGLGGYLAPGLSSTPRPGGHQP